MGAPQVAYRETITKSVESEGKYVKQSGGRGMFGHVWVKLEPSEPGAGYEFENKIVGGVVPREFIPSVEKGIRDAMTRGVMAGYPVIDVKATLKKKIDADMAMDAAICIGCGACVAACPNASAMLFTSAKAAHLNLLPQGQPERLDRAVIFAPAGELVPPALQHLDRGGTLVLGGKSFLA